MLAALAAEPETTTVMTCTIRSGSVRTIVFERQPRLAVVGAKMGSLRNFFGLQSVTGNSTSPLGQLHIHGVYY